MKRKIMELCSLRMRLVPVGLALCAMLLTACAEPTEPLIIDFETSCNIFRPDLEWPGDDWILSDVQAEVLAIKGEPSFVRLWYNPLGDVMRQSEDLVYNQWRERKWNDLKRSWIYLDSKEEYEFISNQDYAVHKLTDKIMMLCTRGDPQDIKVFDMGPNETPIIEWIYYRYGERYKFKDGVQISVEHFQPLHNFQTY